MSDEELFISLDVDKKPYIKNISTDRVINLTGESGSGKSFYSQQYMNDDNYIVIDTDEVFAKFENSSGYNRKFGEHLRKKYDVLPDLFLDFDLCYQEVLEYFKDCGKTIVIDSALFKAMKDVSILRGKLIVMRTSVDTCYSRCVERFKKSNPQATDEEIEKYEVRKKPMYKWYLELNDFLRKVDKL